MGFLDDLPTLPIIPKHDDQPSFDEVEMAILRLKYNKATVPDNIDDWQHQMYCWCTNQE